MSCSTLYLFGLFLCILHLLLHNASFLRVKETSYIFSLWGSALKSEETALSELFSYEAITLIINDISFSMLFLIKMEHVRALSTLTGLNDPGQLHFWPSPCPGAHIFVPYKLSVRSSLSPWADIRSAGLQLSWPWPCTPYPWPEDLSYNHKLFLWWFGLS